jgi:hypothetical protein
MKDSARFADHLIMDEQRWVAYKEAHKKDSIQILWIKKQINPKHKIQ